MRTLQTCVLDTAETEEVSIFRNKHCMQKDPACFTRLVVHRAGHLPYLYKALGSTVICKGCWISVWEASLAERQWVWLLFPGLKSAWHTSIIKFMVFPLLWIFTPSQKMIPIMCESRNLKFRVEVNFSFHYLQWLGRVLFSYTGGHLYVFFWEILIQKPSLF